jgi:hypothetical protein
MRKNCLPQYAISALLAMGAMMLSAGCATQAMKGTPFYTGEWTERTGNVEDRVALWPFVYYRAPALSVLWPIFEKSPDHFAMRPVYSVHGLSGSHRVHRVLWPLGRFDFNRKEHRFFPLFWGDDYFVVFPLYWHMDDPFLGKDGGNTLFPAWIYIKEPAGGSASRHILHLVWPLARFETGPRVNAARIFPLFAARKNQQGERYFKSIPYGRIRHSERDHRQDWLLPLFVRKLAPEESYFYTIPYGQRKKGPVSDRYAMLGLWRHYQSPDNTYQWLLPLYGSSKDAYEERFVSPLYFRGRNVHTDRTWHTVLPLYYHWKSPSGQGFYTLLGGGSTVEDGTGRIVTPLYIRTRQAEGKQFDLIPPMLSWRTRQADRTNWHILGPVSRISTGANAGSSHLLPLFYRNPATGTLLTPLFQKGGEPESDTYWHAVAPLYARWRTSYASAWITPLGALTRNADGGRRTISPLYINLAEGPDASFRAVPPLLSWQHREKDRTDTWLALGLARYGRGEHASPSHLLPLFYRNPAEQTLLSPLWASWQHDGNQLRAVPPLLSWHKQAEDGASGTRILAGLAACDRSPAGAHIRSHVFPLYAANNEKKSFLSAAYARWNSPAGERHDLLPPLLSWRTLDTVTNRHIRVAGGLYGQMHRNDGSLTNSYLFPLYAYRRNQHFLTPLMGRDAPDDGRYRYWLTPLVGTYRNRLSGSWVWPLYIYRKNTTTGHHDSRFLLWGRHETGNQHSRTAFFPLFSRRRTERERLDAGTATNGPQQEYMHRNLREQSLSLLLFYRQKELVTQYGPRNAPVINGTRYHQRAENTNRLFPLWNFRREIYGGTDGPERTTGSLLWRLYDHQTEVGTPEQPHDYVRRRILWRAWHYERLNGHVSVDSLPFITYDKKPDGFRKITFLWRAFRYEKNPTEGTKLDLLFIPLRRSKA